MSLPSITNHIPDIDGNVLRDARENLGLTKEQLARSLCLSPKHVDQIENNGLSSFFSLRHRFQVALRVAAYLNLQPIDILAENFQLAPAPSSTQLMSEQKQIVVQQAKSRIAEPIAIAKKSKASFKDRAQISAKLSGITLLFVLISLAYWATDWLIIRGVYQFTSPLSAVSNELDNDLTINNSLPINPLSLCDINPIATVPEISVELPLKKGDHVLVIAKSDQPVCVIDFVKKVSAINLNTDSRQLIAGQAPFIINSSNFNGLEIFFQGRKVNYPDSWQGPMKLIEGLIKESEN